jgi:hypothetical protein
MSLRVRARLIRPLDLLIDVPPLPTPPRPVCPVAILVAADCALRLNALPPRANAGEAEAPPASVTVAALPLGYAAVALAIVRSLCVWLLPIGPAALFLAPNLLDFATGRATAIIEASDASAHSNVRRSTPGCSLHGRVLVRSTNGHGRIGGNGERGRRCTMGSVVRCRPGSGRWNRTTWGEGMNLACGRRFPLGGPRSPSIAAHSKG